MKSSVLLLMCLIAASCHGVEESEPLRPPEPPSRTDSTDAPIIEEAWDFMGRSNEYVGIGGPRPGRLYDSYLVDVDLGVELERVTEDGVVVWRVHVESRNPVPHSAFFQTIDVRIEGDRVVVSGVGGGESVEELDLATGRLLSREIP